MWRDMRSSGLAAWGNMTPLELVEAYALEYALVLFYEISRLDSLVERLRNEPPNRG